MKTMAFWLAMLLVAPAAIAQKAGDMVGTMPELKIATLDDGVFDLASHRGSWVVLNFWATWCAPCIKEIPELSALAKRDDVAVLGLDFEEIERGDLDAFLAEHPAGYPIAPVDVYDPPKAFPVPRGLPMTYLVAPDGTVAKAYIGPVTRADIEGEVDAGRAKLDDDG